MIGNNPFDSLHPTLDSFAALADPFLHDEKLSHRKTSYTMDHLPCLEDMPHPYFFQDSLRKASFEEEHKARHLFDGMFEEKPEKAPEKAIEVGIEKFGEAVMGFVEEAIVEEIHCSSIGIWRENSEARSKSPRKKADSGKLDTPSTLNETRKEKKPALKKKRAESEKMDPTKIRLLRKNSKIIMVNGSSKASKPALKPRMRPTRKPVEPKPEPVGENWLVDRLSVKISKTRSYWRKDSLLIPNVFRLAKAIPEEAGVLLEHQDLSSKELLVQGFAGRPREKRGSQSSCENESQSQSGSEQESSC